MASDIRSSSKLVVLSNRTAHEPTARAGGLAVALWDALTQSSGEWIGWNGQIKDYPSQTVKHLKDENVEFALATLSRRQYEQYYLGYSNSALWPVLHNRLDLAVFRPDDFQTYCDVNQRFAEIAANTCGRDDFLWVHDYHFFLVAKYLRALGHEGALGFFLHIPFPAPEIFKALPQSQEIIEGLMEYDIVGLQTRSDCTNLAAILIRDHGAVRVADSDVHGAQILDIKDRQIVIRHCPIGMNAEAYAKTATQKPAKKAAKRLSKFLLGRKLIIGVDRMDYTKGLPQRFEAVGKLFETYPETRGVTSFTQIAPPSRALVDEYGQLHEILNQLCGQINGDLGDLDWIPIRYLARGYPREAIAGLYRLAEVCLVTPLQDGMNLVAKEFIAAQDPENPGVLILSQFAGASEQMTDALIVNPHDIEGVADTIKQALNMPLAERVERWRNLFQGISHENIAWWRRRYFAPVPAADKLALPAIS